MSTSDDRPYDQESAHEEPTAGRAGGRDADDTGVERHPPSSATELWDHNAYGREDGDIGGSATSGATDTRDPRGGAPAYNIDAGDDDAVRHGDDSGRDDGSPVRGTGESLTGADATAGHDRESVGDDRPDDRRDHGRRDEPSGAGGGAFDQESTGRDATHQSPAWWTVPTMPYAQIWAVSSPPGRSGSRFPRAVATRRAMRSISVDTSSPDLGACSSMNR